MLVRDHEHARAGAEDLRQLRRVQQPLDRAVDHHGPTGRARLTTGFAALERVGGARRSDGDARALRRRGHHDVEGPRAEGQERELRERDRDRARLGLGQDRDLEARRDVAPPEHGGEGVDPLALDSLLQHRVAPFRRDPRRAPALRAARGLSHAPGTDIVSAGAGPSRKPLQPRRADSREGAALAGAGRPCAMDAPREDLQRSSTRCFGRRCGAFVEREVAPHIEEWEQAGEIPKSLWPRMGGLGFLGVEYDEKYGGGGADFLTTVVLCEEMARSRCASLAMAVGVHTDMSSPHLYWTGSEALKEKYLPAICRGERLCAIAVTEPGGGSDVAAIQTRAVRDGDALRAERLEDVHHQRRARRHLLRRRAHRRRAPTASGTGASRCSSSSGRRPASSSAGSSTRWATARRTRPSWRSRTCGCPADNLLGREGQGFYEVMRIFQRERLVAGPARRVGL